MRSFKREAIQTACGIISDNRVMYAAMLNFSQNGIMVASDCLLFTKKYVSIMYRNEKNQMVRLLTYVVHSERKGKKFFSGLLFVKTE